MIDTFCVEIAEFQDGCTYIYLHCACPVITRLEYRDLVRVCNLHVTCIEIRHALHEHAQIRGESNENGSRLKVGRMGCARERRDRAGGRSGRGVSPRPRCRDF